MGSGGMERIVKAEATTPYYIDPAAEWELVSTSAVMKCGLFKGFNIGYFNIEGLRVEKMTTADIFRIVDPFSVARNPVLAEWVFSVKPGGPYYLIIDARDPQAVLLEFFANDSALILPPAQMSFISFGSLQLAGDDPKMHPFGTYVSTQIGAEIVWDH